VNNPDVVFNISDVMRKTPICWASAKDYVIQLHHKGWIIPKDSGFVFNNKKVIVRFS